MAKKPSYEQQRKQWYAKLKAEGFEDIETKDEKIKQPSTKMFPNRDRYQHGGWQFKAEYYRLASHLLQEHKFSSPRDKYIWELHSNGISYRNIAKLLKNTGSKANRNGVHQVIKKYRHVMFQLYNISGRECNG